VKRFTRIEPTVVQTAGRRFKRDVVIKRFQTEDGLTHEFTTVGQEGSRAGAVIALTPDNRVISMYQFRPGPERWMYDLPGGGIHEGEDARAGAIRELREETGYVPARVALLGTSCRDSYTNMTWHYYLATGCRRHVEGRLLDAEEQAQGAEVRLLSIAELIDHAKNDRMTDPHAVLLAYNELIRIMEGKITT
jgi:ADP-ribose pyrophosphatase